MSWNRCPSQHRAGCGRVVSLQLGTRFTPLGILLNLFYILVSLVMLGLRVVHNFTSRHKAKVHLYTFVQLICMASRRSRSASLLNGALSRRSAPHRALSALEQIGEKGAFGVFSALVLPGDLRGVPILHGFPGHYPQGRPGRDLGGPRSRRGRRTEIYGNFTRLFHPEVLGP